MTARCELRASEDGAMKRWLKAVRLWVRIVGRINMAEYRTGPLMAWRIARCIHYSAAEEKRAMAHIRGEGQ